MGIRSALAKIWDIRLSKKLPLVISLSALFAGGVVGFLALQSSQERAMENIKQNYSTLVEEHEEQLTDILEGIQQDINFMSVSPLTQDALKDFSNAWNKFGSNQTATLQTLYIDRNPHPIGKKEELDAADDGSYYSQLHAKYHPAIRTFLQQRKYYDVFLINPEGDVIYTVFKELDFATNLKQGQWKDTDLAKVFNDAINLPPGSEKLAYADFRKYAPSKDVPAGFIAKPVYDDNQQLLGVIAFQMPIQTFNDILTSAPGLGKTGDFFLIGQDKLLRSQSRLSQDNTILVREDKTPQVEKALAGERGFLETAISSDGRAISAAYGFLDFHGVRWGLVTEIEEKEIYAPIVQMRNEMLLQVMVVLLITSIIGFFIARSISRRVARLAEAVDALAQGDNIVVPYQNDSDEIGDIARSLTQVNEVGQRAVRVQNALESVKSCVMMADENHNITFLNRAVMSMFKANEAKMREQLPNFSAENLLGSNIDIFHKNPSHQRSMLAALNSTYETSISVAGFRYDLTATPVTNSQGDRLGTVVEWKDVTAERRIESEIEQMVNAAVNGDFSQRLHLDGKTGFMLKLSQGINDIAETVMQGLNDVKTSLEALSEGDLTRKISAQYHGAFDEIKGSLNSTVDKLYEMVSEIQSSAGTINNAAQEIASGSQDLSHRTESQASSLEETAAAMEEMTATVTQNARNAQNADGLSSKATQIASEGQAVVNQAVSAMNEIQASSQKIADIISVIDEIAFQTNLLALNAAVEAARAGEAGKGFAVVASEVRALAGRSASASKEIKDLINQSVEKVKSGANYVNQSGVTFQEINNAVKEVSGLISEITTASKEQASGLEEINIAISKMDETTQQNAALVEENNATTQSMVEQATQLERLMLFFRTHQENHSASKPSQKRSASPKRAAQSFEPAAASHDGWEEF